MIGNNNPLFRNIYKAYRDNEIEYHYQPMLGQEMKLLFNYADEEIVIEYQNQNITMTTHQFLDFLSKIDVTFSKILPVGTIVDLDETMFPEQLQTMFSQELGARVVIVGRKSPMPSPFEDYIVDYLAYFWPLGQFYGQQPIWISNMMIKQVISKGYTDDIEEDFSFNVLRASQVLENKKSTAFMDDKTTLKYIEYMNSLIDEDNEELE